MTKRKSTAGPSTSKKKTSSSSNTKKTDNAAAANKKALALRQAKQDGQEATSRATAGYDDAAAAAILALSPEEYQLFSGGTLSVLAMLFDRWVDYFDKLVSTGKLDILPNSPSSAGDIFKPGGTGLDYQSLFGFILFRVLECKGTILSKTLTLNSLLSMIDHIDILLYQKSGVHLTTSLKRQVRNGIEKHLPIRYGIANVARTRYYADIEVIECILKTVISPSFPMRHLYQRISYCLYTAILLQHNLRAGSLSPPVPSGTRTTTYKYLAWEDLTIVLTPNDKGKNTITVKFIQPNDKTGVAHNRLIELEPSRQLFCCPVLLLLILASMMGYMPSGFDIDRMINHPVNDTYQELSFETSGTSTPVFLLEDGSPMTCGAFKRKTGSISDASPVSQRFSTHTMRRAGAQMMKEADIAPEMRQLQLGHAWGTTTYRKYEEINTNNVSSARYGYTGPSVASSAHPNRLQVVNMPTGTVGDLTAEEKLRLMNHEDYRLYAKLHRDLEIKLQIEYSVDDNGDLPKAQRDELRLSRQRCITCLGALAVLERRRQKAEANQVNLNVELGASGDLEEAMEDEDETLGPSEQAYIRAHQEYFENVGDGTSLSDVTQILEQEATGADEDLPIPAIDETLVGDAAIDPTLRDPALNQPSPDDLPAQPAATTSALLSSSRDRFTAAVNLLFESEDAIIAYNAWSMLGAKDVDALHYPPGMAPIWIDGQPSCPHCHLVLQTLDNTPKRKTKKSTGTIERSLKDTITLYRSHILDCARSAFLATVPDVGNIYPATCLSFPITEYGKHKRMWHMKKILAGKAEHAPDSTDEVNDELQRLTTSRSLEADIKQPSVFRYDAAVRSIFHADKLYENYPDCLSCPGVQLRSSSQMRSHARIAHSIHIPLKTAKDPHLEKLVSLEWNNKTMRLGDPDYSYQFDRFVMLPTERETLAEDIFQSRVLDHGKFVVTPRTDILADEEIYKKVPNGQVDDRFSVVVGQFELCIQEGLCMLCIYDTNLSMPERCQTYNSVGNLSKHSVQCCYDKLRDHLEFKKIRVGDRLPIRHSNVICGERLDKLRCPSTHTCSDVEYSSALDWIRHLVMFHRFKVSRSGRVRPGITRLEDVTWESEDALVSMITNLDKKRGSLVGKAREKQAKREAKKKEKTDRKGKGKANGKGKGKEKALELEEGSNEEGDEDADGETDEDASEGEADEMEE